MADDRPCQEFPADRALEETNFYYQLRLECISVPNEGTRSGEIAMKRFLILNLLVPLTAATIFVNCGDFGHKGLALAAGGDSAVLGADHALQLALSKKDANAAGALLEPEFTWTDGNGQTRNRAQFLKEVAAGTVKADAPSASMYTRDYGQLAIVTFRGGAAGSSESFVARIWTKRGADWRLLLQQDTGVGKPAGARAQSQGSASTSAGSAECDNPCRTVPFTAKTAEEGAVVKAYQDVETAVVSHDAATWAYHVADEFVGIGRRFEGTPDTKAGRVGQIGIVSNRVILPKMLWLKVYDYGHAAVMIADHQPIGEPPYHVIRVWVNRDGRWQLFHRQETTIE